MVGVVEVYGIGMLIGDLIEYCSLVWVYGVGIFCVFGLVKSNMGYSMVLVGIVGLIKVILLLWYGVVLLLLYFNWLFDEFFDVEIGFFVL